MEQLTTLAATVTTLVEILKQALKPQADNWGEETYALVIQVVAMVLSIAGAFVLQIDMLVLLGQSDLPHPTGIIVAGILASYGNQLLHYFSDAAKGIAQRAKTH